MSGPYTPTVHVEFAFGYSPMQETTDGSFVEPAATYPTQVIVDAVTIARGRPSEFDTFPPGTCQINIMDRNRILDPQNTAGPYYGDLKPRVPVRVRGKIGSTYYPRFYGYVDGWPLQNGLQETIVNVVATDAFKVLAGIRLNESAYDDAVLDDSPNAYWKLGEEGETAVDSGQGRHDGRYAAPGRARGAQIVPFGNNGSLEMTGGSNEAVTITDTGARVDALPITVEMWLESDAGDQSEDRILFLQPAYSTNEGFLLATGFAGGQEIYLSYAGADDTYSILTVWPFNVYDGAPHHIAVVINTSVRQLYVDGSIVAARSNTGGVGSPLGATPIYIGSYLGLYNSFPGRISNVALYDTALTGADVLAHYDAGALPYDNASSGARVDQVLDLVDWSASARSVDDGEIVLAPAEFEGRTALEYLQLIAVSEQGRLFMSKDGKVTFHARDRFITQSTESTSQFTFSDDGAGDALHAFTGITLDERYAYNEARVSRIGGNPQTSRDLTAIAAYGPITRSIDNLLVLNDAVARSIGDWIVYRYSTPEPRAGGWSLQPEVDANSFADVFDLDIGYRVTLETKPANKGAQIVMDVHIEQVTEMITPATWEIGYSGSPVDANADSYLIWGGDNTTQGWASGVWR